MDLLHRCAPLQGFKHIKAPFIVGRVQVSHDFFGGHLFQLGQVQGVHLQLRPTHRLHNGLLKAGADAHHLAGGLHLGAQLPGGVDEFIKGPLGPLYHHIVQRRFKAGIGLAGNGVDDFIQRIANGDFGRHLGDGITGGLTGQSGRTADPGIDLDHRIFHAFRVQGELTVAAAFHLQFVDDIQRSRPQHLVLFVGQGHRRSDNNGIAGMNADGVKVFHGTDGDNVVLAVPDDFKLDFLPAGDALFNQHLGDGRKAQAVDGDIPKLLPVVGNAAAAAAQGKGGADDHRIADGFGKVQGVLHRSNYLGRNHRFPDGFHGIFKGLAVFRLIDGFRIGPQQFHIVGIQKAFFGQLHGQGQAGLSPQGGEQAVRLFDFNDPFDTVQRQGLNINFIRHGFVGHDGGWVGVNQHHLQALLLQSPAGLGAGVVKLRRLADDNGAGTNHQHLFQIFSQRHGSALLFVH